MSNKELFDHLNDISESLGNLSDGIWKETLISEIQYWFGNTSAKNKDAKKEIKAG